MSRTRKTDKPTPEGCAAILSANLLFIKEAHGNLTVEAFAELCSVPKTTMFRALDGSNAVNLSTLNAIAKGFSMHPWQLLHPQTGTLMSGIRGLLFESSLSAAAQKQAIRDEVIRLLPPSALGHLRVSEPPPPPYTPAPPTKKP